MVQRYAHLARRTGAKLSRRLPEGSACSVVAPGSETAAVALVSAL